MLGHVLLTANSLTGMTTFVVRNTVDEDLLKMQKTKTDAIDAVMQGRNVRLSEAEICRLFGFGRSAPMPDNLHSSDIELENQDGIPNFDDEA